MSGSKVNKTSSYQVQKTLPAAVLLGELIDRRKFILGMVMFVTTCSFIYSIIRPTIYQADALIQVEQSRGNTLLRSFTEALPGAQIASLPEIEIVRSRLVLGKTVDDMKLAYIVKKKWDFLPSSIHTLFSKGNGETLEVNWLSIPGSDRNNREVQIEVTSDSHYLIQDTRFEGMGRVGEMYTSGDFSINISRITAKPGTVFTLRQKTRQEAIQDLMKDFRVADRGKDSGMLGLSLKGKDPALTESVLSSITDNYLAQNISWRAAQDSKMLEFLQGKLPVVRANLEAAEDKLNTFRKHNDSLDLDLEAKAVLSQLASVDNQLNELSFREAEIAQLFKKNHPSYRTLIDKRESLEILKERLNERISGMPETQQEILRLSRAVDSEREIYMQLLSRQQELDIAQSGVVGNIRIIDPALIQSEPVNPDRLLVVTAGFISGLFFSIGLVLTAFFLRRGIETPEELESLGINVFSTIPHSDWLMKRTDFRKRSLRGCREYSHRMNAEMFMALSNPADPAIEAVRSLRTSIHFAMTEAPNKILMISGATQDSGKTFISSTLAVVMAQAGKRVLFIDADMRKGYAHLLFSTDNRTGLSELLKGDQSFEKAVKHIENADFDFIARGDTPDNPSELTALPRFGELLAWAQSRYDIIILDTPPVLAVTDPVITGRYAGTTILVARVGLNTAKEIDVSIRQFAQGGVTVKGAVLNGVQKRSGSYYRHGYHYAGYSPARNTNK